MIDPIRLLLESTWEILLELAPWLFFGAMLAGLLHTFLPGKLIGQHLRGRWGVAKAVLFGVPLPLCSCGVIPAGIGLKKDGASDGAAIGFLISTPQTGVDSILVSASFLGWPFAIFKVASAAVTGLVGGWLTDSLAQPEVAPRASAASTSDRREGNWLSVTLRYAFDLVRDIWLWLLIGVAVSAGLDAWLPPSALLGLEAHGGALAILLALALSLPLYVCATASVPVAAALVAGGMPAGAALVFLMAGPATNLATMGAVLKGFGRRTLAVYLGTVVVGSVGLGLLFDWVISSGGDARGHAHETHATWWAAASAALLVLLLAMFALADLRAWLRRSGVAVLGAAQLGANDRSPIELSVEGLSCERCVRKLETELGRVKGVRDVSVTLEPGAARIVGAVSLDAVSEAVERAGFRPVPSA